MSTSARFVTRLLMGRSIGLLIILFSAAPVLAATRPLELSTTPVTNQIVAQNQGFNPKFAGFDQQPRGCDVRLVNGWFYWYRHGVGLCTVVFSASEADAAAKAVELADSTETTEAGIGYRLLTDPLI